MTGKALEGYNPPPAEIVPPKTPTPPPPMKTFGRPALAISFLANPEAMKAALDQYSNARTILIEWVRGSLQAGIDYQCIHSKIGPKGNKQDCPNKADKTLLHCDKCGGRATLCKPGSEKIVGLLQLKPIFNSDNDTRMMLGGEKGLVCLRCELLNIEGEIVAEGRGARNLSTDYGDPNKTIKMVQKSAMTDAVLRYCGLSEVFSQDLEDTTDDGSGNKGKPPAGAGRMPRTQAEAIDIDPTIDASEKCPGPKYRGKVWIDFTAEQLEFYIDHYAKLLATGKLQEKIKATVAAAKKASESALEHVTKNESGQ